MFARDRQTHEHAERVRCYALELASEAGVADEPTIAAIRAAAVLHDVGKLGIPDSILQKPGPLTVEEYDIVKQHATIGADLVAAGGGSGVAARDRPPPPRELGWVGLSRSIDRRRHSGWGARDRDRRLLRRVNIRPPIPPRLVAQLGPGDDSREPRDHDDPQMTDAFMRVLGRIRSTAVGRSLYQNRTPAIAVHVSEGSRPMNRALPTFAGAAVEGARLCCNGDCPRCVLAC